MILSDRARCWVYQSSTEIPEEQVSDIKQALEQYTARWESHGRILPAMADVLHRRFILIAVDGGGEPVCGRSVDASVRLVRDVGQRFGLNFFDRMQLAYLKDGVVKTAHKDDFPKLYASGEITDDTLFFDNLVQTLGDWRKAWLKPLKESWARQIVEA